MEVENWNIKDMVSGYEYLKEIRNNLQSSIRTNLASLIYLGIYESSPLKDASNDLSIEDFYVRDDYSLVIRPHSKKYNISLGFHIPQDIWFVPETKSYEATSRIIKYIEENYQERANKALLRILTSKITV